MMEKILSVALLALPLTAAWSQSKNFIDRPYVETTATADTLVTPNEIYLSIVITEKDSKGRTSVEELETKMIAQLEEMGINLDEQLSLLDVASNFKKYFLRAQDINKSKAYSLLVYDAVTAGKVLADLEEIGISNVNLQKVDYANRKILTLELITRAVNRARQQAEYMARPLNQKIGAAMLISDQRSQETYYDNQIDQEMIFIKHSLPYTKR